MTEVSFMNRNDFDQDLFSNIEISERAKRNLYTNCKRGKRAGDLRFRYATALTALIGGLAFGCTGIGTFAYYQSVQTRLANMSSEEVTAYAEDLSNDHGVTIDESYSRKLTNEETLKVAELEKKYYAENEFPAEDVKRVASLSDWDGKSVCYVEEDHKLHLPDEMTDDQLLAFIDYNVKKDYVLETESEVDNSTPSPYVNIDAENVSQDQLEDLARAAIKYLLNEDVPQGFEASFEAFKPSAVNPAEGTANDFYTVEFSETKDSSYRTYYYACFNMDDLSLRCAGVDGREFWAKLESFTDEEAEAIFQANKANILAEIKDLYGYSNPDEEWYEVYHSYDDYGDAREIHYDILFGDIEVEVMWEVGNKKIYSVGFYNINDIGGFHDEIEE